MKVRTLVEENVRLRSDPSLHKLRRENQMLRTLLLTHGCLHHAIQDVGLQSTLRSSVVDPLYSALKFESFDQSMDVVGPPGFWLAHALPDKGAAQARSAGPPGLWFETQLKMQRAESSATRTAKSQGCRSD